MGRFDRPLAEKAVGEDPRLPSDVLMPDSKPEAEEAEFAAATEVPGHHSIRFRSAQVHVTG